MNETNNSYLNFNFYNLKVNSKISLNKITLIFLIQISFPTIFKIY